MTRRPLSPVEGARLVRHLWALTHADGVLTATLHRAWHDGADNVSRLLTSRARVRITRELLLDDYPELHTPTGDTQHDQ